MRRGLLVAALLLPALGQDGPAEGKDAVAPTELRHEVRLRSGTALVGRLEPAFWIIKTAFGELKVPVGEIEEVRFGRRAQPERLADVERRIADLGSGDAPRRDHARAALKEAGAFAALSLLRASTAAEDPEVRRLCKEILESLDVEPEAYVKDDDEVETTKFSLRGAVTLASLRVNVPELGALQVRRGDIVSIRLFTPAAVKKVTVGGQNLWPNGWLDTKVAFKKGEPILVRAEGTLHFPNWGGQAFTPDGSPRMGSVSGFSIGTLLGRIGKNGAPFRVGSSHAGKTPAAGTLWLVIMMNVSGQVTTGGYDVTISRPDD